MFGKVFLREFAFFLIGVGAVFLASFLIGSLGLLLIVFDRNPVEATGTVMGIVILVFAAIVFVLGATFVSNVSFVTGLVPWGKNELRDSSPAKFFLAKVLAYEIVMLMAIALISIPALIFARDFFAGKWAQGVEFVAFATIMLPMPALAFSTIVSAAKAKRYVLLVFTILSAVIMAMLSFGMTVFEIQLFVASDSTNMQGLWITMLILLAICAAYDVGAFALTARNMKIRSHSLHENHHSDAIS